MATATGMDRWLTESAALWLTGWLAVRLAGWLDGWKGCARVWLAEWLAVCLALRAQFLGGHGHGPTSGVFTTWVEESHADWQKSRVRHQARARERITEIIRDK